MFVEKLRPSAVPEGSSSIRRRDDVCEQHRGENPVRFRARAGAREELLELIDDRVAVADTVEVVCAGELDEPGARDVPGQVTSLFDIGNPIVDPVHDQGWNPD